MSEDFPQSEIGASLGRLTNLQAQMDAAPPFRATVEGMGEQPWSPQLVTTLSITVFLFGLIICGLMTVLHSRGKSATDLLRLFSLPLIIVSAVVLVIAGYSERQMSPVIGLLGTIAGYLLGSRGDPARDPEQSGSQRRRERADPPAQTPPPEPTLLTSTRKSPSAESVAGI